MHNASLFWFPPVSVKILSSLSSDCFQCFEGSSQGYPSGLPDAELGCAAGGVGQVEVQGRAVYFQRISSKGVGPTSAEVVVHA